MRKVLHIILFWTIFVQISFAQRNGFSHPLCTETNTWIAQCGTRPLAKSIYAINPFITGSKHDANWTLLDRCWVFGQDLQANAKISIVNPSSTQITEVNSPTWTSNQGYDFNGTSQYLDCGIAPNSGTNYTQNSAYISVYIEENVSATGRDMGSNSASNSNMSTVFSRATDNNFYVGLNSSRPDFDVDSVANTDSRGDFAAQRPTSTTLYANKNGVRLKTHTASTTGLATGNFYIGARNNNGSAGSFATRKIGIACVGSGAIDDPKLYKRKQIMATKLGFNQ